MILRPYQQKAVYWINRCLNNCRHPLLVMPTGTGKTAVAGQVAKDRISLKNRLLLIVPQLEIHEQFMTHFSEIGLNPGYINDEGVMGRNRAVYICMYQSLDNILQQLPEKFVRSFSEIIVDEAHHSSAQSYKNIFDTFSHCQRFGMTATPYRMDNKPLNEFYTDLYEPIKMTLAVDSGYLCKPVVIIPEQYQDYVPEDNEIDINEQKQYIDKKIIGNLLTTYKNVFNGLPVIVPCLTHEHAENVTEMFKSQRWQVDHIHSKMSKTERKAIVRRVKNKQTNVLVTVGVGIEGMDIPGLHGIIWLRQTESLTIWMQFNGRAMRPAPGKKYFILVDMVGNTVLHGRPDIDRKWSLESDYVPGQDKENETKMKLCPSCGVMVAHDVASCWVCLYDFDLKMRDGILIEGKKRRLPQMIDGELVYLDKEVNNNASSSTYTMGRVNICDYGNDNAKTLRKHEKIEILKDNLTGVGLKSKFREGLKWL